MKYAYRNNLKNFLDKNAKKKKKKERERETERGQLNPSLLI